jgi:protein-disulfide isomerase
MSISMSDRKAGLIGALAGGVAAVLVIAIAAVSGLISVGSSADARMHDYLMTHGHVLAEAMNKAQADQDEAQEAQLQASVSKLGMKPFVNPKVAFVTGPASAKTTFVEFFDYNCPHCRNSVPAVQAFYEKHRNARFALIEFPIFGADSEGAARVAVAARNQPDKYIRFHFALMSLDGEKNEATALAVAKAVGFDMQKLKVDMQRSDVERELAAAHVLGVAASLDGTPTFIVNGHAHSGEVTLKDLETMAKT